MEVDDISAITQAWRMGQSTNYEYLTQLNKLSGRSFNDLMQYPVFPFILCDYTSNVLDLMDPKSYRCVPRVPVEGRTRGACLGEGCRNNANPTPIVHSMISCSV